MQFKEVLKLVGAGLTGGLLALKIRKPRRSYDEFVRVYETISLELHHQFETVILQTMLPAVDEADRDSFCRLLDRQSSFPEHLSFFHDRIPNFEELIVHAFERLYRLRSEGSIAPTARRRMAGDLDCYHLGVDEVFCDLERSFLGEIGRRLPPEDRLSLSSGERGFLVILKDACNRIPDFPVAFFEGLARFQDTSSHPLRR